MFKLYSMYTCTVCLCVECCLPPFLSVLPAEVPHMWKKCCIVIGQSQTVSQINIKQTWGSILPMGFCNWLQNEWIVKQGVCICCTRNQSSIYRLSVTVPALFQNQNLKKLYLSPRGNCFGVIVCLLYLVFQILSELIVYLITC